VKFGHLAISEKWKSSGFGYQKGAGKSGSRECVKINIKGMDKKRWPQFCHIDADFKISKRDLELALYVSFTCRGRVEF